MSHATKEQRQTIDHLIALVESGLAAPQEILNLALFQLEPEHDGSRAIQLLKTLPHEQRMRDVWLAFAYIYEIMDQTALSDAVTICTEIRKMPFDADVQAAALMLRASALRHLRSAAEARADAEESIQIAPHWVGNRQLLAQILTECAERPLRASSSNVLWLTRLRFHAPKLNRTTPLSD